MDVFEARYVGRALRRHGLMVLALGVLGALAGLGFNHFSEPLYRAESVLLVNIQSLRIGADGVPMDVELVMPARQLVGAVCESDRAMSLLSQRLAEQGWHADQTQRQRVARLRRALYYDQRSLDLAVLRATSGDAGEAALLVNEWALVSRALLIESYGTTAEDLAQAGERIEQAKRELLEAERALADPGVSANAEELLDRQTDVAMAHDRLDALTERLARLSVRQEDSSTIARIVSSASPPTRPTNPSAFLVIGLFVLAGVFLGLAVGLLRGPGGLA